MKMNKRFILFMLALIMFLSTNVYAETPQILEINSEIKYGPFSTGYVEPEISEELISLYSTEEVDIVYNYGELKDSITKHMKNYKNSFVINYKGKDINDINIMSMINEILEEDHYLLGTLLGDYGVDGVEGYVGDARIYFIMNYTTNKGQEQFVDSEVVRVVNEIIEPGMSDFQKVKSINDWIVNNTRYDQEYIEEIKKDPEYMKLPSPHAAYTLFKEGTGVCQAYALAAHRLLEEAGFEVKYVTGNAGGIGHAWNLVKVDGEWYHLDTTWNDPTSETQDILSYKYFLISDNTIKLDHTMDNRTYPVATDKYYESMRDVVNPLELDNYMYYINYIDKYDFKLYKLNLDTMEKTQLTDDNVQFIVGYGDWIYYSNYSLGGYLYKTNIDGTVNEQLNSVHSIDLYIEFPYLHFYDKSDDNWDRIAIVEIIDVTGISLNRTEDINLTVGGQATKLQAYVEPADATIQAITWVSSNPAVATVKDGLVTAVKAGTTTITATTDDGNFIASVNINVKDDYKILKSKPEEKSDPKYMWTIKLSKAVKEETVNFDSVYIENEFGDRLNADDFEVKVDLDDSTIITLSIINNKEYEKDKVYYVVVENTLLATEEDEALKEAVKMPFIIR